MVETSVCLKLSGFKHMHFGSLLPEVLREARWWLSSTTTCPWGAIAFLVLLLAIWSFVIGFVVGAVSFNSYCRRCLLQLARACIAGFETEAGPVVDLRHRLARYRQTG